MPWSQVSEMENRYEFVLRAQSGECVKELCVEYGISRTVGYKLLKRCEEEGIEGARPRSRCPHNCPDKTPEEMIFEVVSWRQKHPSWGGRKLAKVLKQLHGSEAPSARNIDRILQRCNLSRRRRPGRRRWLPEGRIMVPRKPNDVWTADFKGWWKTKDGKTCFPLTIRDEYSKYILDISALAGTGYNQARRRFERCFEQYGLPNYIRTDNGGPFAAISAVQGLSRLSAWWIRLGVTPNRIDLASPSQNGGHERMHRDLKADVQSKPAPNIMEQQLVFDDWRHSFNTIRPHEALNMRPPAEVYSNSERCYSANLPPFDYPEGYQTRKVDCRGHIFWRGKRIFVSSALVREKLGLCWQEETLHVWFCDLLLGVTTSDFSLPLGEGNVN